MRTFARVQDGQIVEVLTTAADITTLFHPSLYWVDVSDQAGVAVGWRHDGRAASPPPVVPQEAPPTLADLRAAVAQLAARIEALHGA